MSVAHWFDWQRCNLLTELSRQMNALSAPTGVRCSKRRGWSHWWGSAASVHHFDSAHGNTTTKNGLALNCKVAAGWRWSAAGVAREHKFNIELSGRLWGKKKERLSDEIATSTYPITFNTWSTKKKYINGGQSRGWLRSHPRNSLSFWVVLFCGSFVESIDRKWYPPHQSTPVCTGGTC